MTERWYNFDYFIHDWKVVYRDLHRVLNKASPSGFAGIRSFQEMMLRGGMNHLGPFMWRYVFCLAFPLHCIVTALQTARWQVKQWNFRRETRRIAALRKLNG